MSEEYPTISDLGIALTADEDRMARNAINGYGDGGHPMADDQPTLRAADFVAEYVRDCLFTAIARDGEKMSDLGMSLALSLMGKLDVVTTPPRLIPIADKE